MPALTILLAVTALAEVPATELSAEDPAMQIRRGDEAYARGDCEAAVREWRAAYQVTRERELLVRISRCPEPLQKNTAAPLPSSIPAPDGETLGGRGRSARRISFALAALGVGALGLGLGFALAAESVENEIEERASRGEVFDATLLDEGRRDANLARGSLAAGIGFGLASFAIYYYWGYWWSDG